MGSGTENHGKNLISWKILIKSIILQIMMMSVSINIELNAEHCYGFGEIKDGLIK